MKCIRKVKLTLTKSIQASYLVAVQMVALVVEDPGESKVGDLEMSCGADEEVGWFEVAVHDVVRVAELDALQQHQCVALDLGLAQRTLSIADHLQRTQEIPFVSSLAFNRGKRRGNSKPPPSSSLRVEGMEPAPA